jgi:hypothetical protein
MFTSGANFRSPMMASTSEKTMGMINRMRRTIIPQEESLEFIELVESVELKFF